MSTFVIHATQLEVFVPRLALRKRYGGSIHFQINRILIQRLNKVCGGQKKGSNSVEVFRKGAS